MSKPEDIPQDVWDAARAAVAPEYDKFPPTHRDILSGGHDDWPIVRVAARAIMAATQAERKACADLAMAAIEAGDERHDVWLERYDVAISIASAIRKRGEPL